jgi:hypothetical protein
MNKKELLARLGNIASELMSMRNEFEDDDYVYSSIDGLFSLVDETIEKLDEHFD